MRRACVLLGLLLAAPGAVHAAPLFVTRTLSSESGCTADRLELRAIEFRHAAATDVGPSERYLMTNAQGAARFLRPGALRPGTISLISGGMTVLACVGAALFAVVARLIGIRSVLVLGACMAIGSNLLLIVLHRPLFGAALAVRAGAA